MSDENIYNKILLHLDGWIIQDNDNDNTLTDTEYNKTITTTELDEYYSVGLRHACSYLGLNEDTEINPLLLPFVYMWTAGLLYKKYDVRPNDLVDETAPIGYGDQLIISAKVGLKPYRKYTLTCW